ncbi:hypothetical protein P5673_015636, partial [Acropora cervicornis]
QESADVVQTFVGGLELPYGRMTNSPLHSRTSERRVKVKEESKAYFISKISSSHNCDVVPLLIIIDLVNMDFLLLIQRCSGSEKILQSFSQVVIPLADGLKYCSDVVVKWSITCALERLSNDLWNCVLIYQRDALKSISAVMNRIPG